jgi:hypothetical protein
MREMTAPKQIFANAWQKAHLRRTCWAAGGTVAFVGLALNWDWLTAAGLAPIILGILPCAVMCALGLCAHRFTGGAASSCHGSGSQSKSEDM